MHQGQTKNEETSKDSKKTRRLQRNQKTFPASSQKKRRILITKIINEKGEIITSRKGIANVFGEFFRQLFDDQDEEAEMEHDKDKTEKS